MKFFLVTLFTVASLYATAQGEHPLKLNGSVGYAQPLQSGVSGGLLLTLEPKLVVTPTIDVGIRVEAARLPRSVTSDGKRYATAEARFLSSYLVTGSYWLSKGRFQSFAGVGAGLYQIPATDRVTVIYNQSPNDILFEEGSRFGGMIRYGVKTGHYVASIEYNAALSSTVYRSATPLKSPNSYLSIKIGYEVGGYKKPTPAKP